MTGMDSSEEQVAGRCAQFRLVLSRIGLPEGPIVFSSVFGWYAVDAPLREGRLSRGERPLVIHALPFGGVRWLPVFGRYTVDCRLREFRTFDRHGWLVCIPFDSDRGDRLLVQYIRCGGLRAAREVGEACGWL